MDAGYREKYQKMFLLDEGLRLKAYKCPAGFNSLGYGRNLDARGVRLPQILYYQTVGISKETAMKWLDEDVAAAERDCRSIFGDALFDSWGENRRLGWINLAFNLGRASLLKFHNTLMHARNGNWRGVRLHLQNSLWFKQVKGRGPRVVALICDEQWKYG